MTYVAGWRMYFEQMLGSCQNATTITPEQVATMNLNVFGIENTIAALEEDSLSSIVLTPYTPIFLFRCEIGGTLIPDTQIVDIFALSLDLTLTLRGFEIRKVIWVKPLFASIPILRKICPNLHEIHLLPINDVSDAELCKKLKFVAGTATNKRFSRTPALMWQNLTRLSEPKLDCRLWLQDSPLPIMLPLTILRPPESTDRIVPTFSPVFRAFSIDAFPTNSVFPIA